MKTLLICTFFISSYAFSKECETQWQLKAKGLNAGVSFDKLIINEDKSITLMSHFTPNAALKLFGAKEVKRKIVLNNADEVTERSESIEGETVTWKKQGNNYQKSTVDNVTDFPFKGPTIDSTIFPYLQYLDLNNDGSVNVLSSETLYKAQIKSEGNKIDFIGEKGSGYALTDAKKYPHFFKFTSQGNTIEGFHIKTICKD